MDKEIKKEYVSIDEYILEFPGEVQDKMRELREIIRKAAPKATEKISWAMPTFYLHGNLVHFAAHKSHIGFYPGASGVEVFSDRLLKYKTSKGAIQFPLSEPLPKKLIQDIVKFRVTENIQSFEKKEQRRRG